MGLRVHLLRAVNVGGATLPMAELRALASGLGATGVRTHLASGNLLCVPPGEPEAFDRALEAAVRDRFGFSREVISRSPGQLRAALEAHPFEVADPRLSHVVFLLRAPEPAAVAAARAYPTGDDRWQVLGAEMHVRYARGAGRAQLPAAAVGRALGVAGTARNLNTVRALVALSGG